MNGYAATRGGTFGVVHRTYRNEDGVPMAVIRWGPLGWLTPVYWKDVRLLSSTYEGEARAEADAWLKSLEGKERNE